MAEAMDQGEPRKTIIQNHGEEEQKEKQEIRVLFKSPAGGEPNCCG
jgi:hypothetical protein